MPRPLCPCPQCPCSRCFEKRETASRLVDRGADLRDIRKEYRPFVLAERDKRGPIGAYAIGGGNPNGETAIARGEDQYEGGGVGPWHENAVRALEDGGEA